MREAFSDTFLCTSVLFLSSDRCTFCFIMFSDFSMYCLCLANSTDNVREKEEGKGRRGEKRREAGEGRGGRRGESEGVITLHSLLIFSRDSAFAIPSNICLIPRMKRINKKEANEMNCNIQLQQSIAVLSHIVFCVNLM